MITTSQRLGLVFAGSTSLHPGGGIPLYGISGIRLGRVSLYLFSGLGMAMEFNLKPMLGVPPGERPDPELLNRFLVELEGVAGFEPIAVSLRTSWFGSRKPNLSLSGIPLESFRPALETLRLLAGTSASEATWNH